MFGTIKVAGKFKREMEQNCLENQNETFISIGLFIGGNCSKALEPLEVIQSEQGGLYPFKTLLGWCIVVTICETTFDTTVACNRISVKISYQRMQHHIILQGKLKFETLRLSGC